MKGRLNPAYAIPIIAFACACAGCDPSAQELERQARMQAQRRETEILQFAQEEQRRREFWQGVAFAVAAIAVVLLVAGVAMGSRSRDDGRTNP